MGASESYRELVAERILEVDIKVQNREKELLMKRQNNHALTARSSHQKTTSNDILGLSSQLQIPSQLRPLCNNPEVSCLNKPEEQFYEYSKISQLKQQFESQYIDDYIIDLDEWSSSNIELKQNFL